MDFNFAFSFWLNGKPFEPIIIDLEIWRYRSIVSILAFGTEYRSLLRIGYDTIFKKRIVLDLFWIRIS